MSQNDRTKGGHLIFYFHVLEGIKKKKRASIETLKRCNNFYHSLKDCLETDWDGRPE